MWGIILIAGGAVLGFFVLRGGVFLAQDIIYYKRKEREGSEAGAGKPNKVNNEDILKTLYKKMKSELSNYNAICST